MNSSRRNFLAGSLALPAAGLASVRSSGPSVSEASGAALAPEPGFRYRVIGKTGLKVTTVGFGCMITSDPSVIAKAADIGINYFDTARGYQGGNNERMVGAALKSKRNQLYISTKTGATNKQTALEHIDTSLKELGTDHVEIWYLHNRSTPAQIPDELIEAQEIAKKAGKIRFAGVSTHDAPAIADRVISTGKFDVVLATYNFTMDQKVADALARLKAAGVGIVGMKVMAGGFRRVKPGEKLYETLKKEGAMVAALKWVLRDQNVDTTIPSITDMDQLDENLRAMTSSFTDADRQILAAHLDYIKPMYCRMCHSCAGACPKGLPVADMLRFLTYADGYGQFALGRERFLELPEETRAVRCQECSSCAVKCPNGVHVTERLIRAQELFA